MKFVDSHLKPDLTLPGQDAWSSKMGHSQISADRWYLQENFILWYSGDWQWSLNIYKEAADASNTTSRASMHAYGWSNTLNALRTTDLLLLLLLLLLSTTPKGLLSKCDKPSRRAHNKTTVYCPTRCDGGRLVELAQHRTFVRKYTLSRIPGTYQRRTVMSDLTYHYLTLGTNTTTVD